MTEDVVVRSVPAWKVKLVGLVAAGSGLAASASAAIDINATISPLITMITALIPSLIDLVVALIPLMCILAIAKFFPQLFETILGWIKI